MHGDNAVQEIMDWSSALLRLNGDDNPSIESSESVDNWNVMEHDSAVVWANPDVPK